MSNRTYLDLKSAFETPRKTRKSAAGRRLVRWNPDMDQQVLLHLDAVCAKRGIALPWDAVASEVVEYMTGEAIKQHLVKLHRAREEAGLPVPDRVDKTTRRRALQDAKLAQTSDDALDNEDDDGPDERAALLWGAPPPIIRRTSKPGAASAPAKQPSRRPINGDEPYTPTKSKRKTKADKHATADAPTEWTSPTKRRKPSVNRLTTPVRYNKRSNVRRADQEDVKLPVTTPAQKQNERVFGPPVTPQQTHNLVPAFTPAAASDTDSTRSSPSYWASHGLYAFPTSSTPQPDFLGPLSFSDDAPVTLDTVDPAQMSTRDKLLVFGSDSTVANLGLQHEAQAIRLRCGVQPQSFFGGVLQHLHQQKLEHQKEQGNGADLSKRAQALPDAFIAGGDHMMFAQEPVVLPDLEGFDNNSPTQQMPYPLVRHHSAPDHQHLGMMHLSPSTTNHTASTWMSQGEPVEETRSTEVPGTCSDWTNGIEPNVGFFGRSAAEWDVNGSMAHAPGPYYSQYC